MRGGALVLVAMVDNDDGGCCGLPRARRLAAARACSKCGVNFKNLSETAIFFVFLLDEMLSVNITVAIFNIGNVYHSCRS